jgi:tRNA threonylcarbamoyl adenosine modification protein YeaZ
MRLLAIDTALEACSVGVVDGAREVLKSEVIGRGHAERLMGMIEAAMGEAGLAFAVLDRIAVTVGPGSFTGLRVGIAAARGLALVTGIPAIGIGTLSIHAETARDAIGDAPVLAVLAAGRGEIYGQSFAADGTPEGPPAAAPAEDFARRIAANTLIAGSGAAALAEILGDEARARTVHERSAPDIAALCRLARAAAPTGEAPRPLYLRPPDAKPQTAGRIARQ